MSTFFSAYDGTRLAYRVVGDGPPLVCLPGGPMQASACLGDLGGLSANRQLIMLDLRGTGESAIPSDIATYRCDRLVDDVEALREHLGLDRIDLLAHCAGANLAVLYAVRHAERINKLALITPSVLAVGIETTGDDRLAVAALRKDEPWFAEAFAALEAIVAGKAPDNARDAIAPFYYRRWDDAAQAHRAAEDRQRNNEAAAAYAAEGAFDPDKVRAALAHFDSPVLLLAGEVDLAAPPRVIAEFAALFPNANLVIQPETGHFPWLDDPTHFVQTTATFLK